MYSLFYSGHWFLKIISNKLAEWQQVTLWFILDLKIITLTSSELGRAGLLGIEMVEARSTRNHLAVLGEFQSLCI